jgi:hypothetical protein
MLTTLSSGLCENLIELRGFKMVESNLDYKTLAVKTSVESYGTEKNAKRACGRKGRVFIEANCVGRLWNYTYEVYDYKVAHNQNQTGD